MRYCKYAIESWSSLGTNRLRGEILDSFYERPKNKFCKKASKKVAARIVGTKDKPIRKHKWNSIRMSLFNSWMIKLKIKTRSFENYDLRNILHLIFIRMLSLDILPDLLYFIK